mgnify:CR=1 FL=1
MANQNNAAYLNFVENLNVILMEINVSKLNYS